MSTPPDPWQPSDLEAYCFLKSRLPAGFTVQAEPSTDYFSEWGFRYRLLDEGRLVDEIAGDFRAIVPGSVTSWALDALERARSR
jgi:hypothetical protein